MTEEMVLIFIILVPLFGALLTYVVGCRNKLSAGLIATSASAVSFGLVCYATLALTGNTQGSVPDVALNLNLGTWLSISTLNLSWNFVFDHLSAVMCLLITGVGTLIHIYSIGYMSDDEAQPRFFSYLNLFLASMLVLVLGGSLPVLFIGWEGVGLCSYLLIGFWFKNSDYAKAAQKAFVMNRIGDLGMILAMFLIFQNFNTLEFSSIAETVRTGTFSSELLTLIGAMLLIGAFGKSAQLPLFTWLPDAMAGPTPVSALIHAATMVTAGIYLVARMFPIFDGAPDLQLLMATIAVATAFITATIALVQTDIKKVLAYSTVSQLGFMFVALSSGAYWVAIFHVITHGFFKACLFLSAGSVIHGCHHEQDMRKMGGLSKKMPLTFISFSIATIAIAGVAPFAGYFSKHAILEAFANYAETSSYGYVDILAKLITATSFLTAFYMGRCWVLTFFGTYRGDTKHSPHEVPAVMSVPVLILAAFSLMAGLMLQSPLHDFLAHALPASPVPHFNALSINYIADSLAHSWLGIVGLLLAAIYFLKIQSFFSSYTGFFAPLINFLKRSFYLDEIYDYCIVKPLQLASWLLWKVGDELGLYGLERAGIFATQIAGGFSAWLQSGQVRHYAALSMLGLVGLVYLLIYGF